ncbi:hypothetical protein NQ315_016237 [Exocentrus adspersus]|uniref:Uncharacterized protein n=1 Tax=Exocentrus adspersus TaxID=1586481 RepID=A0AAV8VIX3_9CUCU|nr:hypothetical protein NQ315_016237 [Exocentrus adspersus]
MPKPFSRQAKELISNLTDYFEDERGPLIPLAAVREKVSQALKINVSTVNSISTIVKSGGTKMTPVGDSWNYRILLSLE